MTKPEESTAAIVSLWIADLGGVRGLTFRPPAVETVDGLRFSHGGVGSRLRTGHTPRLLTSRAVWVAVWDDAAALDRFVADLPRSVAKIAAGCRLRLEPIRVYQQDVSIFDDALSADASGYDGPVLVATVNKPRLTRIPPFLVASVPAEKAALARDDLRWSMGFSRPPRCFATLTLWDSATAATSFAFGNQQPAHRNAIVREAAKSWFDWSITIRCRPISIEGELADGSLGASLVAL